MVVSVLFGIVHNQISARVSIEYFTVGHSRIIDSVSPVLLGIAWGVKSTWWVGLCLGILLSLAARTGNWPVRSAASLVKPMLTLVLFCAASSASFGIAGYLLSARGMISVCRYMIPSISPDRHAAFVSALWMHTASYTAAAMGGLILSVRTFAGRLSAGKQG